MVVNEELFDASRAHEGAFRKEHLISVRERLLKELREWFHEIADSVDFNDDKYSWLRKFQHRIIKERAVIISFNWDLILDALLYEKSLSRQSYGFGTMGDAPILLKPHGSLNWFEHRYATHMESDRRTRIFDRSGDSIDAFLRFRAPYSKSRREYIPLLVPPIYAKNFARPFFQELWNRCTQYLSTAAKVIFVGYSMPLSDLHARFIVRCGFHNQLEGQLLRNGARATATGPARVTIVNPDQGAAQRAETVVGPVAKTKWIPLPVAQWVEGL